MIDRLAADGVLVLHLVFIVFAVFGAATTVRWRWIPLMHVPAAVWAIYIELAGKSCPLTYLENYLRIRAGQAWYGDTFIDHFLLRITYSSALARPIHVGLAAGVVVINIGIYAWFFHRRRNADGRGGH